MKNLSKVFRDYGFDLSDKQVEQFNTYYDFLISENKKYNLTAITDYDEVLLKHFIDSVLVCKYFDFTGVESVCDIGSGGGFPLVPIKILYPHLKIFLLDALNKRVKFLELLCDRLALGNCTCMHDRAENFGHGDMRESFDITINRAVANTSVLSEYCLPLTKLGGYLLLLKGSDFEEELDEAKNAIDILGGDLVDIFRDIELGDYNRNIIKIRKISPSPGKYPRKVGIPTKRPL